MDITERFEVIDNAHGEGGFGKVQKRKDKFLERLVAIKELKLIDDEEAKERFKREAIMLARVAHPVIPAIYDVDFTEDYMRIIFEYIDGKNLADILKKGPTPSIDLVRRWFSQVGMALQHVHKKGIIHRDIKPANVIISPDSSAAYLVDFGIALTQEDVRKLTKAGYVIGTPAYMSPEQKEGKSLDARSDIYSLGLTLYETLAGSLPAHGDYQSLSEQNEAIPPAVDELIKNCLVPDKLQRIPSASDFVTELRNTTRTDVPLSSLLTEARLHEIISALGQLSPDEFHLKNLGQRLLIVNRMKDLVRVNNPNLSMATAQLISLLVRLSIHENEEHYSKIVSEALIWGFDKKFSPDWSGEIKVREELLIAAKISSQTPHKIISEELLEFVKGKDLEKMDSWYLHALRRLVMVLLANTNCGDYATGLGELYDQINIYSHSES